MYVGQFHHSINLVEVGEKRDFTIIFELSTQRHTCIINNNQMISEPAVTLPNPLANEINVTK